jgi:TonB-linked SusC/RagA family outer membrane protein
MIGKNLSHAVRFCAAFVLILFSSSLFAQKKVSGTVLSAKDNQPVNGATVLVKGTTTGVTTGTNGTFSINVPTGNNILVVSYVGFTEQEVDVSNSTNVNVTLKESISNLNEIVVTGYTAQRKKDITGAVSVVDMSELKAQPAASPVEALQGKAAGVQIINDGAPGSTPQIRIRGFSTINNNDPLYVIDGMPYEGKLSWLSSNDIESMQVLKDASAASIYGSRANNGVVIITTRKGRKGPPKLSLNTYYGVQAPNKGRYPEFLNPTEYANYFYQEFINKGLTPGQGSTTGTNYGTSATTPTLPEYLLAGTKTGQEITAADADPSKYNYSTDPRTFYQITKANQTGTDWMRAITRNAPMQNYELSLLGGGENSSYAISGGYFAQDGTVKYTSFKRAVIRANTNFTALNNRLTIGENMQYSWNQNIGFATNTNVAGSYQGEGSVIGWVYRMQTIIPVYDIMGNFAGTKGNKMGNAQNPLAVLYRGRNNAGSDNQFFGSAFAELKLLEGLSLKTNFGLRYDNFKWNGVGLPDPEFSEGSIDRNTTDEHQGFGTEWTWTNTLTYKRKFNVHNISAFVGTEAIKSQTRTLNGSGNGYFLYGNMDYYSLSTAATTSASSSAGISSLYSLFGRVDYTLKDRYLFTATVRRDGSSNFGPNNRFGVFPAANLGWRISQEGFMKNVSWINDLKVRGGYGVTGNQRIPPFQYLKTYQSGINVSSYPITGGAPISGLWINSYDNPNIKWEQLQSVNIGLDFSIFDNKIEGTFDWYNRDTKDMLYPVPQPSTAVGGGASPYVNIGKMNNKGVELSLTYHYQNPRGADAFKFDVSGNISRNVNKLVELAPGIPFVQYNTTRDVTTSILQAGYAFGSFYGYKMVGIYQNQDDITKGPSYAGARIGGPKYADISGPNGSPDGIIDANDRTIIGNPMPKFIYSLGINASYKHFDLYMFFNASVGNDLFDLTRYFTDFNGFDGAVTKRMLDAWSPSNTGSMIPSPYRDRNAIELQSSSYYVQNGSFLKMKNLQIGYNFPTKGKFNNAISNLRLYVSGTNLFTVTKYTGMDPEVSQMSSTYSAPGVDIGVVPMSRQFLFGLNVTF